jgi:hypothetical protein
MSFNSKVENFKNKKNLVEELNFYKSIILKKVTNGDYNSALEKVRSALILIQEHKDSFNTEKELLDFYNLSKQIQSELNQHKMVYERRFNNLLREKLDVTNLENFTKLLAMLKNEVDNNLVRYHLQDISMQITKYFKYIKKMYEILSCYKILNYHDASDKIFEFVRDIKCENFPNLKMLISLTYQDLINNKLFEYSREFDRLSLSNLSKKMAMNQDQLCDFINILKKQPKSPVQDYLPQTQEIIFKRSK